LSTRCNTVLKAGVQYGASVSSATATFVSGVMAGASGFASLSAA
jgi:hypothetical protein